MRGIINSLHRNKNMQKRGQYKRFLAHHLRITGATVVALLVVIGATFPNLRDNLVAAATCSTINDCQNQINNDSSAVASLKNDATSYQDAISKLRSQISSVQQQINISEAEQASLQQQIATAQAELAQQKLVLGTDLKMEYVNSDVSTAEMLASSQNLSAFADSETYRSAVQAKIQDTLNQITALEAQLQTQQTQVAQLLSGQRTQAGQLAAAKSQQQSLLSYNSAQQASLNVSLAQNQQKLSALIAAQRAVNDSTTGGYYFLRFPGAGKRDPMNGSYPYANYPFSMSTAPGCVDGDGPDQWGYCTRQCVSYAAWAVQYSGGAAPIDWGNAKDWVGAARRAGIPVYATPQPGDIAIDTAGTWGHAMYVEQVSGSQIYVAQYNQQLTGQFSTQWRSWE